MRKWLKRAGALLYLPVAYVAGVTAQRRGRMAATVLCYHDVGLSPGAGIVSLDRFRKQAAYLARARKVISTTDFLRMLECRHEPGRSGQPVVLTFDDGLKGAKHALDILRQLGLPATMFVVSSNLGDTPRWIASDSQVSSLSATELQGLDRALVTIGSHTSTHCDLVAADADVLQDEVGNSRRVLEDLLRRPVTLLAYPWGRWNERAVRAVEDAGYHAAFAGGWGNTHHPSEMFHIKRVTIDGDDTYLDFRLKLAGAFNWLDWIAMVRCLRRNGEPNS